jgi:hypothetical protein
MYVCIVVGNQVTHVAESADPRDGIAPKAVNRVAYWRGRRTRYVRTISATSRPMSKASRYSTDNHPCRA